MDPLFYLITGVMASGKSTVADLLAKRFPRAVHLRGDAFRRFIVSGREEMTQNASQEALRQLDLRYRLAAQAAIAYWNAGFTVVLQDNYYGEMLPLVLSLVAVCTPKAVVLCPSVDAIQKREQERGKTGYHGFTVEALYQEFMAATPRIGLWLDTTSWTPEETVEAILKAE